MTRVLVLAVVLFGSGLFLVTVTCCGQLKPVKSAQAYLDVSGGQLYYEECGSGATIVLLHDGLLDSAVWDDVWPRFCAKYHVLRYDRRGYGKSPAAKATFSPLDDLAALMKHAGMSRATIVGSSSGSALAIDFAITHPENVDALFLIGPVVHGMRSSDYFLQRGNAANAPLAKGDVKGAAENWSKDRFQISGDRPEPRKKVFDILTAHPQNLSVPGQFEARPSPPTVTVLSHVLAPTLEIVGEADIADVHAFAGAIQAEVPVVRREVWQDDGHLIQVEKPAEVVARLETFLGVVERNVVSVPGPQLERYKGTYSFFNSAATIAFKNNQLFLQLNGDADIPLFAESESHFFVRTTGTDVTFERDANGEVNAMVIHSPGADPIRCPRIKNAVRPA